MKKDKKASLSPDEERHLQETFHKSLPEGLKSRLKPAGSCSCSGCSCPPGNGDICDGGTYVGYTGSYYGAMTA